MENPIDNEFPFTGDEQYDKLVKSFYIFRGVLFSILFFLNIIQTYFELRYLINKQRKSTPRLYTFISITMFPLCRCIQSFLAVGLKNTRTGSASWYLGIWGTLFMSTIWIFIGVHWTRLIYTFFASKKVALSNLKITFLAAWVIVGILVCWNIVLMVMINYKSPSFTANVSSKGFISMVALLGTFLIVNGFFLIRNLKTQDKKSKLFQKAIERTTRLSLILIFIVLGLIVREIVVAISKISTTSNYRYAAIFVTFILEYPQCILVMVALADDGVYWKNYFLFKKVSKDSNSSASSMNDSGATGSRQQNLEIDLNSFNMVDNENYSGSKKSSSQLNLQRQASTNSNMHSSKEYLTKPNNNSTTINSSIDNSTNSTTSTPAPAPSSISISLSNQDENEEKNNNDEV